MVLAYHSIFCARGFWLPNDPRGSGSDYVRCYELYAFGPATKTTERHSVAHRHHDRQKRLAAKQALAGCNTVEMCISTRINTFAMRFVMLNAIHRAPV